jgi:integrase
VGTLAVLERDQINARELYHLRIKVVAIQQRAGHSSLVTTQRYIEVTPDQERKAVRAIRL